MVLISLVVILSALSQTIVISASKPCKIRQVKNEPEKLVCVCDDKYCDDFQFEWPNKVNEAYLIESTLAGLRFKVTKLEEAQSLDDDQSAIIRVDLNSERQIILGWGGAFTDATGINIGKLSESLGNKLIESYYGPSGLRYNFGRVPIGGSDFSPRNYSYDDSEEADYELKNWALAREDIEYKIPAIKQAIKFVRSQGDELKLFGSPWSPPKWMKTSNSLIRGALIDDDRIYKSYANYLIKFYDAYEKHGIKFWGATVQNEPIQAFKPLYYFNILEFYNEQMIKFISKYLGPALVANNKTKENFKLMVGDESLGGIGYQIPYVMADPEVRKYVAGYSFHWYDSGTVVAYDALSWLHDKVENFTEFVIMSEACAGASSTDIHVDLGNWHRGELYGTDIIEDLIRQTGAWIDWNMVLDMQGGPNWVNNFVDSPIIVNEAKDEFYKQPMYYVLGHFSRFFRPGSVIVESSVGLDPFISWPNGLMAAAVHNKETNHLVVNIMNKSNQKRSVGLSIEGLANESSNSSSASETRSRAFVVEPRSMNTFVLKL